MTNPEIGEKLRMPQEIHPKVLVAATQNLAGKGIQSVHPMTDLAQDRRRICVGTASRKTRVKGEPNLAARMKRRLPPANVLHNAIAMQRTILKQIR